MLKLCRFVSRSSLQRSVRFSSSSSAVACSRFSDSSTDEDEEEPQDHGSAVYRQKLKTQRPTTIKWPENPRLHNTASFIGTVDRRPVIYNTKGRNFGAYTFLSTRNPLDSNHPFRIQVEVWHDTARMCIQHLKRDDYVYVSGPLRSYTSTDNDHNATLHYKIVADEVYYVARQNESSISGGHDESRSEGCQKDEVSASETFQEPDNPQPEACPKYEKTLSREGEIGSERSVKRLQLWQAFFSRPHEWFDWRTNKKHSRFPDFKHKDTGEALWLSENDPPWIKRQLEFLDSRMVAGFQDDVFKDKLRLWQVFFSDPHDWWDNRKGKKNPRSPDFKHKHTDEALWLSADDPPWVKRQLQLLDSRMAEECQREDAGHHPPVSQWMYSV
ncbi:hypothetical protein Tsubulata_022907 [Turnera subulata]|uniref:Uncharacterized protein n=1 Tax=Turnera subulata TaxID=218843 RepID=A0A9Q0FXB1_9ROSI|nr:hypothetical protein Tsubulata_022907 [Turnera subulata]